MLKKIVALAFLSAIVLSADVNYPSCTGSDCTPTCNTAACNPPAVPCPQAGPAWCTL